MAIVDLSTGEVSGARKGTLKWWHEIGHLIYNKDSWNKQLDWFGDSFFRIAVASIIINQVVTNAFINSVLVMSSISGLVLWFLIYQYEEIWCWIYAWKHRKDPIQIDT